MSAIWIVHVVVGMLTIACGCWTVRVAKVTGIAGVVLGALFLGYGIYLGLFLNDGPYVVPRQVFAAPAVYIGTMVRTRKSMVRIHEARALRQAAEREQTPLTRPDLTIDDVLGL